MDDEGLEGGNQISPTIMGAIERSRLSIVVFSENYGYSTWCLDELSKIIECVKTRNQMVSISAEVYRGLKHWFRFPNCIRGGCRGIIL